MLKPEVAKARLQEWLLPEDEKRLSTELQKLPVKLRDIATKLSDPVIWDNDYKQRIQAKRNAATAFDELSTKDRLRIFNCVSPVLSDALESAWQLQKGMPYQRSSIRKAFRSPNMAAHTIASRGEWIESFLKLANHFPADTLTPSWLATWAAYFIHLDDIDAPDLPPLFAAIIDSKHGESAEVLEILRQSLNNQHEIAAMGRHVTTSLQLSSRTDAWELVEKTLLAAQRQEGLRQAIVEEADFAHPDSFRRMLRLILDHDLIRFSSVVRSFDVWLGQLWAAASAGHVKKMLGLMVNYLEDSDTRKKALQGKDGEAAYLALWSEGTEDALASARTAGQLLRSKSVEIRFVAAKHLKNLGLDEARRVLRHGLDDDDLRVAVASAHDPRFDYIDGDETVDSFADQAKHFDALERLFNRLPEKPTKLKPIVWPWTETTVEKKKLARTLLHEIGNLPPTRLVTHFGSFDPHERAQGVTLIANAKPWSKETRALLVELAGDASQTVRENALQSLRAETLKPDEMATLESYLSRKTGDLRRGVFAIVLKQNDQGVLGSVDRLLDSKDGQQRTAALEILRLMVDERRAVEACRKRAADYRGRCKKLTKDEDTHLTEIAKEKVAVATLDDALGLMNPADRSPVIAPKNRKVPFITPAAVACLKSLDDLIHEHRDKPIQWEHSSEGDLREERLLGNVGWGFPSPHRHKSMESQKGRLPLAEIWTEWFENRPKNLRDKDGQELLRASIWKELSEPYRWEDVIKWSKNNAGRKQLVTVMTGDHKPTKLRYERVVHDVMDWLLYLHPLNSVDYLQDAVETAFSLIPNAEMQLLKTKLADDDMRHDEPDGQNDWRESGLFSCWRNELSNDESNEQPLLSESQVVRQWQLAHWLDQPVPEAPRIRPSDSTLLGAYAQHAATLADIADSLLGPREKRRWGRSDFSLLAQLTSPQLEKPHAEFLARHPEVADLVQRAVKRILELELQRGDVPTAASEPAQDVRNSGGVDVAIQILTALGKDGLKTGSSWRSSSADRRQSLTHLAKVTYPAEPDSPAAFSQKMKAAVKAGAFPEERVLQLTFLAPQWAKHVEHYYGWKGLCEGLYWFLAHMSWVYGATENAALAEGDLSASANSESSGSDSQPAGAGEPGQEKLSAWDRMLLDRSTLTNEERSQGAIDTAWFRRVFETLGEKHWLALASAAKFASNASQARRAQFIADVLLNKVSRQELIDGIQKKQLKESVRLLGLLPLATGKKRDADLNERCRVLQEYRRYANKLSGLTKPDALRACEIGFKNLAITADYSDPMRLEWAISADAMKDLMGGSVSVKKGDVTVTLTLDALSKPEVTVVKSGAKGTATLKSIPPDVKKDKKIAELTGRVADIKKQSTGIRKSLEAAMCRGDCFTGDELRQWCGHALLAPLLSRLVVVGDGILGFPDKQGKALRDQRGKLEPVKSNEVLRLAHPFDLLQTEQWPAWQHECFAAERLQPFKQIFRELYVVTKQEKKDGTKSNRYAGQQVQPKQALALFGSRGWDTRDGVFKIFHDENITVAVGFQYGITTAAEVEGWTMASVTFTQREQFTPMKLSDVPPRLFSEVMRDVDLVVSVAHAGGVDPEASASTVEMRTNLLRETCQLLQLKNIRFQASHALIKGQLADYTVHLGSGTVHRMPGGSLCIVPVHAQHRGRLFLPFADDDPRTAEVISKVILLARDHEIQDPSILDQIR